MRSRESPTGVGTPFDLGPLCALLRRLDRSFLLLCAFLALETALIVLSVRIAPVWVLSGTLALWLVARLAARRASFYVACYLAVSMAVFFAGEAYFRVRYLGLEALSPRFTPRLFSYADRGDFDPATYTGHRPGDVVCYGKRSRFNIDGFRGESRPAAKPKDSFRIVWIGASVGWGAGVPEGGRYTDLIERALNRVEVVNLSMIGATFGEMLDVLKEVGSRYQPDLVVLETARTMIRHTGELVISRFRHVSKSDLVKDLMLAREGLPRRFFLANYLFFLSTSVLPTRTYPDEAAETRIIGQVLDEAKKLSGSASLALFEVPTVSPTDEELRFDEAVKGIASERGIPVLGAERLDFPGGPVRWTIYPGDRHPTGEGHRRIADRLIPELASLIPPRSR